MRTNRPLGLLACTLVVGASFAALPAPAWSQSKSDYCSGYAQNYAKKHSSGKIVGGALTAIYPEKYIYDVIGYPKVLAKDFVDLKIDTDRMVGGKDMHEADLAAAGQKGGGIPWIEFFDADGKLLVHSTGPEGNTGFPVQDAEIEWFAHMLDTVRQNLTAEDVQTLRQSLLEAAKAQKERDEAAKAERARRGAEKKAAKKAEPKAQDER